MLAKSAWWYSVFWWFRLVWYVHERQIDAFWGALYMNHLCTIYIHLWTPQARERDQDGGFKIAGDAGHGSPEAKQSYRAPGAPEPQRGAVSSVDMVNLMILCLMLEVVLWDYVQSCLLTFKWDVLFLSHINIHLECWCMGLEWTGWLSGVLFGEWFGRCSIQVHFGWPSVGGWLSNSLCMMKLLKSSSPVMPYTSLKTHVAATIICEERFMQTGSGLLYIDVNVRLSKAYHISKCDVNATTLRYLRSVLLLQIFYIQHKPRPNRKMHPGCSRILQFLVNRNALNIVEISWYV